MPTSLKIIPSVFGWVFAGTSWKRTPSGAKASCSMAMNLDLEFSRFEQVRSSTVDVGAFFVVGPAGVAVTRGYDFASLFKGSGGVSVIRTLVSDWKTEGDVRPEAQKRASTSLNLHFYAYEVAWRPNIKCAVPF